MPYLEGHRSALAAQLPTTPAPDQPMTVTLLLKSIREPFLHRQEERLRYGEDPLPRDAFLSLIRPPAERVAALVDYFAAFGVRPVGPPGIFLLRLTGNRSAIAAALGLSFSATAGRHHDLFYPDGEPSLPTPLADYVEAIYGLDNLAEPHRLAIPEPAHGGLGFLPADIQSLYNVPELPVGRAQTIALPEFGSGFSPADVAAFWRMAGIERSLPLVVSVEGGQNDQGMGGSADLEATLDVAWAGALAPGARLVVYEAPVGLSYASFAEALLASLHAILTDSQRNPRVVSISYGDGETSFPRALVYGWDRLCRFLSAVGTSVLAAAGDQGSYGLHLPSACPMPHVDVPAACPYVTAVGGTTVLIDAEGRRVAERAWSDTNGNGATGGGISQHFPTPWYQEGVNLPPPIVGHPGRGVPDVALNADPDSGYAIVFQGTMATVGGTSVACPIWAAIVARILEARAAAGLPPLGLLNPRLYALKGRYFLDITEGNNAYLGVPGYSAGPGWDAVSGWGVPDVSALIAALSQDSAADQR